ncbi:MAG: hypothetical protein KFB93_08765 [Simkaniaceae bacterium]|nr:MAG: hypothetical protein KFB93_08765 [Simkaniaceae bacterium]
MFCCCSLRSNPDPEKIHFALEFPAIATQDGIDLIPAHETSGDESLYLAPSRHRAPFKHWGNLCQPLAHLIKKVKVVIRKLGYSFILLGRETAEVGFVYEIAIKKRREIDLPSILAKSILGGRKQEGRERERLVGAYQAVERIQTSAMGSIPIALDSTYTQDTMIMKGGNVAVHLLRGEHLVFVSPGCTGEDFSVEVFKEIELLSQKVACYVEDRLMNTPWVMYYDLEGSMLIKHFRFFSYPSGCFKMSKLENQFRSEVQNQLLTGQIVGEIQKALA